MTKDKSYSFMTYLKKAWVFAYLAGVVTVLLIWFIVSTSVKGEDIPEGVVALVDGKGITTKELYDEMVELYGEFALENLAVDRFVELEVKEKKIKVSDEEIASELETVKSNYQSNEDFESALKETGQTLDELKKDIEAYVKLKKLLSELIDTSDEALKKEFETNKDMYNQKEQVNVEHILVEDEKLAKDLYKQIMDGADFKELAKEHSTDYNHDSENGASLGYFGRGEMVEEFEEKVFSMTPGEISEPFKTQYGWHIVKLNDKVEEVEAKFDDVKESVKNNVINSQLDAVFDEWLLEMKDKYKFESKLK